MGRVWPSSAPARNQGVRRCFGGIIYTKNANQHLNVCHRTAMAERWPKHNFQSTPDEAGWTTTTACLEGSAHGQSMGKQWAAQPMASPWAAHGQPTGSPRASHGQSMGSPLGNSRTANRQAMGIPWASHAHPTDRAGRGHPVGIPRAVHVQPMGILWIARRQPMDTPYPTGSPWALHRQRMGSPWVFYGHTTGSSRTAHGQATGMPRAYHGQPLDTPRTSHGKLMGIPWAAHGSPCTARGQTMGSLWTYHEQLTDSPWAGHGHRMGIPLAAHGYLMVIPWTAFGQSIFSVAYFSFVCCIARSSPPRRARQRCYNRSFYFVVVFTFCVCILSFRIFH